MPAMMNVEQATMEFDRVVDYVASDHKEVTILRSGRPVVRIVPVRVYRTTEPDPRFAGSISTADLFSDDSSIFPRIWCDNIDLTRSSE